VSNFPRNRHDRSATFVIDAPATLPRRELRRVKLLATLVLAATFALFLAPRRCSRCIRFRLRGGLL